MQCSIKILVAAISCVGNYYTKFTEIVIKWLSRSCWYNPKKLCTKWLDIKMSRNWLRHSKRNVLFQLNNRRRRYLQFYQQFQWSAARYNNKQPFILYCVIDFKYCCIKKFRPLFLIQWNILRDNIKRENDIYDKFRELFLLFLCWKIFGQIFENWIVIFFLLIFTY